MTVVSDASPLITLAKVGSLHVLPALFGKVIIATEVFHEVTTLGAGRPGASDIQRAGFDFIRIAKNQIECGSF